MKVCFPKTESDVDRLLSGGMRSQVDKFIPVMPKAALALQAAGFSDFRLPIDYVARDKRNEVWQQAISLSRTWLRNLEVPFYRGVDLVECCRLEMLAFFQDVITANMFADVLLMEVIDEGVFFRRPSQPSEGRAMHDGTADIFEAVLQWRFQLENVRVTIDTEVSLANSSSQSSSCGMLTRIYRRLRRLCGRATKVTHIQIPSTPVVGSGSRCRLALNDLDCGKQLFVGYGSGYDLLVMWPYLEALARERAGRAVLVNISPELNDKTLRSGLTGDGGLEFVYAGDIPVDVDNEATSIIAFFAEMSFDLSRLPRELQNPLLSIQFDLFKKKLIPQALTAAQTAFAFFSRFDTAFYLDDWCGGVPTRAWAAVGNSLGIPTANVPHGATNLVEYHSFSSKWGFAWGELGRRNIAAGCPEKQGNVLIVGDPSMEAIRAPLFSPVTRQQVLLLTGGSLQQVWTDVDITAFVKSWSSLLAVVADFPQIEFIVKTHPSYRDFAPWYRLVVQASELSNIRVIDNERLETIALGSILAIIVGRPGTAGVVTILQAVPTVYFDSMLARNVIGFSIWDDREGVPRLTCINQICELITSLINTKEERGRLQSENARFLDSYLAPFNVGAAACCFPE